MKKQIKNNQEEYLFDLIETKEFAELNPTEREFVQTNLGSEEKYTNLRKIGQVSNKSLIAESEQLPLPIIDFTNIHPAKVNSQKESIIYKVINYKVPVYQFAAVVAIIVISFILFGKPDLKIVYQDRIKYIEATATIAQKSKVEINNSIPVNATKIKAKPKPRIRAQFKSNDIASVNKQQKNFIPPFNKFVGLANLKQLEIQKKGVNFTEDPAVLRVLYTETARR